MVYRRPFASKIGRITTTGFITEYSILASYSDVRRNHSGAGRRIMVYRPRGKVRRITTAGIITEYPIRRQKLGPGIAAGPDGAMWFTENWGNRIGRITKAGVHHRISDSDADGGTDPGPYGITAGPGRRPVDYPIRILPDRASCSRVAPMPSSLQRCLPASASGASCELPRPMVQHGYRCFGIHDLTIYASDSGGPFIPWLTNTSTTQATYSGVLGPHLRLL